MILHLYVKSLQLYKKFQSASREPKQLHMGCINKCGCTVMTAYVPCPKDHANHSSFKWASSSSSTCTWICSSEPIWLSYMNLLTTVMESNGLQHELIGVTNLRFKLLHLRTWFYLGSNGYKQFNIVINVFNLFKLNLGYMSSSGITSNEVFIDPEPIRDGGVASISARCDTALVFVLSTYWEMVDFNTEVSSNVTCWLNTIFLFSGSHNL